MNLENNSIELSYNFFVAIFYYKCGEQTIIIRKLHLSIFFLVLRNFFEFWEKFSSSFESQKSKKKLQNSKKNLKTRKNSSKTWKKISKIEKILLKSRRKHHSNQWIHFISSFEIFLRVLRFFWNLHEIFKTRRFFKTWNIVLKTQKICFILCSCIFYILTYCTLGSVVYIIRLIYI